MIQRKVCITDIDALPADPPLVPPPLDQAGRRMYAAPVAGTSVCLMTTGSIVADDAPLAHPMCRCA